MNENNILEMLDKLFEKKILPHEFKTLYDNCRFLSGLQLKHPELIYLKWMSEDEFERLLKIVKERI